MEVESVKLEGLSPSLRQALDATLKAGWGNIKWSSGFTALHLAACDGHEGAVRLLLKLRATPTLADRKGFTAVHYATKQGHKEIIALLQRASLEADSSDRPQLGAVEEPLRADGGLADRPGVPLGLPRALHRYCELVHQQGWESISWQRGFTGLHLAAQLGSADAVRFLLLAGAHDALGLRDDRHGLRPFDVAQKAGHEHLLRLLEPTGSSSNGSSAPTAPNVPADPRVLQLEAALRAKQSSHDEALREVQSKLRQHEELASARLTSELSAQASHVSQLEAMESAMRASAQTVEGLELAAAQRLAAHAEAKLLWEGKLRRQEDEMAAAVSRSVAESARGLGDAAAEKLREANQRCSTAEAEVRSLSAQLAAQRLELSEKDRQLRDEARALLERTAELAERKEQLAKLENVLAEPPEPPPRPPVDTVPALMTSARRTVRIPSAPKSLRFQERVSIQEAPEPVSMDEVKGRFSVDLTDMSDDEEEKNKVRNNRASVASIASVGSEWYDTNGSDADEGAPITSQLSLELRNDVIQESPNGAADGVSSSRDLAAPNFSMTKLTTSALKKHSKIANNFDNDLDVGANSGRFSGSMTVTGAKTPSTSNRDSNGKVMFTFDLTDDLDEGF